MSTSAFSASQHQASTLYLPPGPWATVLECLCEHFAAISREHWLDRIARGRVLDVNGNPIPLDLAYKEGLCIYYFREVPNEKVIPVQETILYADEHLVVADKPHFLPVTPAGEYVEQTLLRRLIRRLDNPALVPLHRIDRHTAGLVLFSANPSSRSAYQQLFPTRQIDKFYEAIAPAFAWADVPVGTQKPPGGWRTVFRMQEGPGAGNTETAVEVREKNGRLMALRPVSRDRQEAPAARAHDRGWGRASANVSVLPGRDQGCRGRLRQSPQAAGPGRAVYRPRHR